MHRTAINPARRAGTEKSMTKQEWKLAQRVMRCSAVLAYAASLPEMGSYGWNPLCGAYRRLVGGRGAELTLRSLAMRQQIHGEISPRLAELRARHEIIDAI